MTRTNFSKAVKAAAWARCAGLCECCRLPIRGTPQYDHVLPDTLGGDATLANCMVLCHGCHAAKTYGHDRPRNDKAVRVLEKNAGIRKSVRPMAGGRRTRWKKKMDGTVVLR